MGNSPRVIAFYLPQYHPIKENDEWFGKGFTEWTNVGKAKPLFKGHYQPRVPADLGYYDLRIPAVRKEQARLAQKAGIEGFCYYHYWFGAGQTIMDYPLQEVVRLKEPDYPFCLCWANHDWFKKEWDSSTNTIRQEPLLKMEYLGVDDAIEMFIHLLPVFKDDRYIKVNGKLLYVILDAKKIPYFDEFKRVWNRLAEENGLPPFYFVAYTTKVAELQNPVFDTFDSVILELIRNIELGQRVSKIKNILNRIINMFGRAINKPQFLFPYKDAMSYLLNRVCESERFIPTIVPNWDWSPRRKAGGLIFRDSSPELFQKHVEQAIDIVKNKSAERKILFLKSWNEWGEGNYMEPDLRFGHGYINALRNAIRNSCK